jgi:hypothetical protein
MDVSDARAIPLTKKMERIKVGKWGTPKNKYI